MSSQQQTTTDPSQPTTYSPSTTALLLLDYHTFIIQQLGENASSAVTVASKLRTWAHKSNIKIYHGLIDTNDFSGVQPQMKLAGRQAQLEGVKGSMPQMLEEAEELKAATASGADEKTFTRPLGTVSAFSSPGFLDALKRDGIRSLIVGGLSTSGCVNSTVRAATDLGFVVTVVGDACADGAESVHEAMVGVVLPMTAFVEGSETVMGRV